MKKWTIGNRQRRNVDIGLDDSTVSGLHAVLTRTDDGKWLLEDCNSTNGTARLLNGQWQRINRTNVLPDDHLRFGRTETTVRQLLASPEGDAQHAPADTVPWTRELIAGFSASFSLVEAKKNLLFIPSLILSPSEHILKCAYRRHPVNPFCFMIFCGLAYTIITRSGMSLSSLTNVMQIATVWQTTAVAEIPWFAVPLALTLVVNMSGFWVFRHFSSHRRSFDDFMRMTAILSGMSWILQAFALLLLSSAHSSQDYETVAIFLMIIIVYIIIFNIIGYKHFWKISYIRAIACSLLTGLVVFSVCFVVYFVIFFPLVLISALGH